MNDRELEAKLQRAVAASTPDVWEQIRARCAVGENKPQPADEAGAVVSFSAARKRRQPWARALACVAALVLVIGGFGMFRQYQAQHAVDSVIALDVNPSVELQINAEERVLHAVARNVDAEGILDGMDLSGATLDVAVNALIGSMLKNGYISELANSILVSVESGDQARSTALQERLAAEIDSILQSFSVEGAVISQTVTSDESLAALASENQISAGKASLINTIIAQNSLYSFTELAKLSINELTLLVESQQETLTEVVSTGTASDKAYIGREAALALALEQSGLTEADILYQEIEMDFDDGQMVYEVEFFAGEMKYEYEIAAGDGAILKMDTKAEERPIGQDTAADGNMDSPGSAAMRGEYITANEARAIALLHAGIDEADAWEMEVDFDVDDGVALYEVEWYSGRMEYDYEIDALNGEILKYDAEVED